MPKPLALVLLAVLLLPMAGAAGAWEIACDDCCPCSGLAPMTCAGCACCPGPLSLAQPPRLVLELGSTFAFSVAAEVPRSTPPRAVLHVPKPA